MRKEKLKNCPKWLIDANTYNEDVEWGNGADSWIVWHGGDWLGGVWLGGVWLGGVWLGGVWRGGVWHGGVWLGGVWLGGVWRGGVWRGGDQTSRSAYIPQIMFDGKIRIGCKIKTRAEWDSWFSSDEEYSTKRNTKEFKMIWAHYCAVVRYGEIMGLV